MVPVQIGLAQFLSTAESNTTNIPNPITSMFARILGMGYYIALAILAIAIIYYGAMFAFGDNPDMVKRKLMYVIGGFVVIYLLPRIADYITGAK